MRSPPLPPPPPAPLIPPLWCHDPHPTPPHPRKGFDANGRARPEPSTGRLEGLVLRSQLLVLLQRRHFCDAEGRPIGRDYSEAQELELEVGGAQGGGAAGGR